MRHLELPTEFPVMVPARSPPTTCGAEESQVEGIDDSWSGKDWFPPDDLDAANDDVHGS